MQYQTFRGAHVQEALLNVREALGVDALIESTRHVRSGAAGHSGRPLVDDVAPNAGAFHRVVHQHSEGLRDLKPEVLLVLPAWLRARDAERALEQYASPDPTGIVITKLDETDQVGGVMHAPLGSQLPITYLCDGARVPEDIHDAAIDRVLDAIFPEQA